MSVVPASGSVALASKLMTAPSASVRSPNSVLKTGAGCAGSVTVQVKQSVSVSVPSLTVMTVVVGARAGGVKASVPLTTPVLSC